nr:MAG TPA: hypothetical protein [Caudoviricetes sp.]
MGIPFTSFHCLLNTHNSQGISFLRLCSYIFKDVKHESLIGELCVFNRHQGGGGVNHMYKTKGPYN